MKTRAELWSHSFPAVTWSNRKWDTPVQKWQLCSTTSNKPVKCFTADQVPGPRPQNQIQILDQDQSLWLINQIYTADTVMRPRGRFLCRCSVGHLTPNPDIKSDWQTFFKGRSLNASRLWSLLVNFPRLVLNVVSVQLVTEDYVCFNLNLKFKYELNSRFNKVYWIIDLDLCSDHKQVYVWFTHEYVNIIILVC